MDIHYAIPSHGRADKVNGWGLRALADAGVPAERVTLFVTPAQLPLYRIEVDRGLCGAIEPGGLGLGAQRRAIDAHYGDGALVVQLDDDIRRVMRRHNDRSLAPVDDLPVVAADAFALCSQFGARLWGCYPTLNAGWMSARTRSGLVFVCGGLFGHVVDARCGVTLDQKEDFERTLRYWEADGTVLRLEWLGMRTSMYLPGGMQSDDLPDRARLNAEAVRFLRTFWPKNVQVSARVGKAGQELRLVS